MHFTAPTIPKLYLNVLNHIYEIECKVKVAETEELKKISRNIERIKNSFKSDPTNPDIEIYYEDPMGQTYDETRNDLDASIAGNGTENLIVVNVTKPIIRCRDRIKRISIVVQKGIVIVKSTFNQNEACK